MARYRGCALAVALLVAGCSGGGRSSGEGAASTTVAVTSTSISLPAPAAELAGRLGCTDLTPQDPVSAPPGRPPIEAADCLMGEAHLSIFSYGAIDEARAAFAALMATCAPAVGGPTWIVWANTNEAAIRVAGRLGGTLSLVHDGCP